MGDLALEQEKLSRSNKTEIVLSDYKEQEAIMLSSITDSCQFFDNTFNCVHCINSSDIYSNIHEGSPGFMRNMTCLFLNYFGRYNLFKTFIDIYFNYKLLSKLKTDDKSVISVADNDELFIIKNSDNTKALVNEAFVALCGTNNLRFIMPNFGYIFFYGLCPNYIVDKASVMGMDNSVDTRCCIYENVKGDEISVYVNDYDTLINYFMQTIYAIAYAEKELEFTHYDLHGGNVIIRKLNETVQITYKNRNNENIYLKTDAIATIIDYETATIKYNNKNYGLKWDDACIDNRPFALQDCYKLLYYILYDSYTHNNMDTFNKMKYMYSFFSTSDIVRVIENHDTSGAHYLGVLPRLPHYENLTAYDFIDFINNKETFDFISTVEFNIKHKKQDDMMKEMEFYLLNPLDNVPNMFAYYDLYMHIAYNNIDRSHLVRLHKGYVYNITESLDFYNTKMIEFNNIAEFSQYNPETEVTVSVFKLEYNQYIKRVIQYYYALLKITYYTHALEFVSTQYDSYISELVDIKRVLTQHRLIIIDHVKYIKHSNENLINNSHVSLSDLIFIDDYVSRDLLDSVKF